MTHRLPMQLCPKCGYAMDAHSNTSSRDKRPPIPGDIGVCFQCFETLVFDENMKLQTASADDLEKISEEMVMKLRAMQTMKKLMDLNRPIRRETRQ